jgi:hypothetical protein
MPWYSDFGSLFIGQLDPKTGKVTDYPPPLLRPNEPTGTLQIDSDPNGDLWVAAVTAGSISARPSIRSTTSSPSAPTASERRAEALPGLVDSSGQSGLGAGDLVQGESLVRRG